MTQVIAMLRLLTQAERRRLIWLLPAVTLTALLQVIGIASVMPFFALVQDPSLIAAPQSLWQRLYEGLGFNSYTGFLIATGLGALALLLASNLFTLLTNWGLQRFAWDIYHSLSKRLLRFYMAKPYSFFLTRNTAELGKNVLSEVHEVVLRTLLPALLIVARGATVLFIVALLVAIDPYLALLGAAFLGSLFAVSYLLVRRRLSAYGALRIETDRDRFASAIEALSGIKEIKLLGKEETFLARYERPSRLYASATTAVEVIAQLPRYLLEVIAFGGMVLMVLYFILTGAATSEFLPRLIVYALGLYRLMPGMQYLFNDLAVMRGNLPMLAHLLGELEGLWQTPELRHTPPKLPLTRQLELERVSFRYPGAARPVLNELSLVIPAGSSVAFVGETGSGKTTTVDLILGLLTPDSGELRVDGLPLTPERLPSWQRSLGYVPQSIYLNDDSIAANIAFGVPPAAIDMAAVERAAKQACIHEFICELPQGYATPVGERGVRLSGGQRQRLGIARALYFDPEVLVFDEATSALDGATEAAILAAIRQLSGHKTLIIVAHRLATVRHCQLIYLLERGRLVAQGRYDELIATSPQFRRLAQLDPLLAAAS